MDMELENQEEEQLQAVVQEKNEENSIILTLPPHLEIDDEVTSSSLVRSESGQLFLITYDASEKVISKHEINIQVSADDFLGLKCNNPSEQSNTTSALAEDDGGKFSVSSFNCIPGIQDDRSQAG